VAAVEKIKESASPQIFSGTATGKAPSTARFGNLLCKSAHFLPLKFFCEK
jgi:hypothetical protein